MPTSEPHASTLAVSYGYGNAWSGRAESGSFPPARRYRIKKASRDRSSRALRLPGPQGLVPAVDPGVELRAIPFGEAPVGSSLIGHLSVPGARDGLRFQPWHRLGPGGLAGFIGHLSRCPQRPYPDRPGGGLLPGRPAHRHRRPGRKRTPLGQQDPGAGGASARTHRVRPGPGLEPGRHGLGLGVE